MRHWTTKYQMRFFIAVLQLSIILCYDTLKILKSGLDRGPIILADINDKKRRYMPNSKNNVWSSFVSMVIEFESKNNLWMHFECGIEFVDDNNIGISMYLYSYSNRRGEKCYKDVIAEFGENPYGYDTMPEKYLDDGIVYRNIKTVYKHDELAPNIITEIIRNAYNSVRNK